MFAARKTKTKSTQTAPFVGAAAASLLSAIPALADVTACGLMPAGVTPDRTNLPRSAVVSKGTTQRVRFRDGRVECLSRTPGKKCDQKTYVISGDEVVALAKHADSVCAAFTSKKGKSHWAWLPADRLEMRAESSPKPADWVGTWVYGGVNKILIAADKADASQLQVSGTALFKTETMETEGEFAGKVKPDARNAKYKADGCEIDFRLEGSYLVVDDNLRCGGMNVTFEGIYRKI